MILEHCQWHQDMAAQMDIDEKGIKTMAQEFFDFHRILSSKIGNRYQKAKSCISFET